MPGGPARQPRGAQRGPALATAGRCGVSRRAETPPTPKKAPQNLRGWLHPPPGQRQGGGIPAGGTQPPNPVPALPCTLWGGPGTPLWLLGQGGSTGGGGWAVGHAPAGSGGTETPPKHSRKGARRPSPSPRPPERPPESRDPPAPPGALPPAPSPPLPAPSAPRSRQSRRKPPQSMVGGAAPAVLGVGEGGAQRPAMGRDPREPRTERSRS